MQEPARRLFVALWPEPAWTARLLEQTASLLAAQAPGARLLPRAQWHVTLCFIGAVREPAVASLTGRLAAVRSPQFTLQFDRVEYWLRPRLLCLCAADPPPPALELVGRLADAARGLDLTPDVKPFRPHVTLARALPRASARLMLGSAADDGPGQGARPGATIPQLALAAERFCLVESVQGPAVGGRRYRILASWPLGAIRAGTG